MSTSSSGSEKRHYCAYCGRLRRRCACHLPDSAMRRFLARGGRDYAPLNRDRPYKRGVPPQIKRQQRRELKKHYRQWHDQIAARDGECCANCGAENKLALDHILPIAKGGESQPDNLQLLCATCNQIKGKLAIDCRGLTHPE